MTPIGPNTAFVLVLFGLLGIYAELVWPGRRFARVVGPGVLGLAVALAGAVYLSRFSPTGLGLGLLGAAALSLAADICVNSFFLLGIAGTAAAALGFWKLVDGPRGISAWLAFPLSGAFGLATIVLNSASRRARRNKRADIP